MSCLDHQRNLRVTAFGRKQPLARLYTGRLVMTQSSHSADTLLLYEGDHF